MSHTLRAEGFDASEDGTGRGTPLVAFTELGEGHSTFQQSDRTGSLRGTGGGGVNANLIAYQCHGSNVGEMGTLRAGNGNESGGVPFVAETLTAHWHNSNGAKAGNNSGVMNPVINSMGVRRLMPIECERLQGFPDDWTRYGADGEEMSDSVRYRMMGNAVAVPCVEWIGRRLMEVAQ